MLIRQFIDHTSFTYTYLIVDEATKQAALIDPVLENAALYVQTINELGATLNSTFDTHTHADHITASGELRALTGCKTYLGFESNSTCIDHKLVDGEIIQLGNIAIKAIYTPGHTDDSYSFYVENTKNVIGEGVNLEGKNGYIFTGDTLLIKGSGRTDFQQGDALLQYNSLFKKILTYSDETIVYPGHDYQGRTQSTIGEEKRFNPRLQINNAEEYAEIMDNLNLPEPKLMDIALPANISCGKV
jgi:glyoxylase-like metal-dependent hydrolase (beta-lactamase superfamily II)